MDSCKISCVDGGGGRGAPGPMQVGMVLHAPGGGGVGWGMQVQVGSVGNEQCFPLFFNGRERDHVNYENRCICIWKTMDNAMKIMEIASFCWKSHKIMLEHLKRSWKIKWKNKEICWTIKKQLRKSLDLHLHGQVKFRKIMHKAQCHENHRNYNYFRKSHLIMLDNLRRSLKIKKGNLLKHQSKEISGFALARPGDVLKNHKQSHENHWNVQL